MFYYEVNYLSVLIAAVIGFVIGWLWYGPIFGKQWMAMMGLTKESMLSMKMKPTISMILGFVSNLILAYALSIFASVWMYDGLYGAFKLAFWGWLGFVVTATIGSVLWENKSWNLYLFNIAYHFVLIFAMSIIIFVWM